MKSLFYQRELIRELILIFLSSVWDVCRSYAQHTDTNTRLITTYPLYIYAGGRFAERAYSMEAMYAQMKSIVPNEEWADYVATLLKEASEKRDDARAVYIYTQEKMWENYMQYLRNEGTMYDIDEAPQEVWNLYKEELLQIYTTSIRRFFEGASNRNSYYQGVEMLRNLIAYGGKAEADMIVSEQMSRTPRRPALIDELSKL